jgi:hypothetical protein
VESLTVLKIVKKDLKFRSFIEGVQFPALEHFSKNKLLAKDIVYLPDENIFTFYG